MSRMLVTGGAGFIGSHLVSDLVEHGHDVTLVARPTSSLHRLAGSIDSVRIVSGEVDEPAAILAALGPWRPEVCAHLAWYGDPATYLTSRENLAELRASLSFLTELFDAGCASVVITGTCAEYLGSDGPLTEDSPTGPRTLYAAAKLSLKLLATQLAADAGASLAWARLFHLYGPQEREGRLVPAVINTLLGERRFAATEGTQIRDYLHVADVASALRELMEAGADGTFNVCSGTPTSVRDVVGSIAEIVGRPGSVDFGAVASRSWDPPVLAGDNARLVGLTGWKPSFGLRGGLADTVEWWRSRKAP
jgi:nucleoside-diphosphate-sugar epimerase